MVVVPLQVQGFRSTITITGIRIRMSAPDFAKKLHHRPYHSVKNNKFLKALVTIVKTTF